ncbi:hypothetical protein PG994_003947 [Apiospora phragmitis]|uniref:Ankyrin n=1 Tax=Apiospora phragmitis TaxID=2905665 RepID=A0ABR1VZK8_9PEZI
MFFTSLPRELIFQILADAVHNCVSHVIVESGILTTHPNSTKSVLWPRYCPYRALNGSIFLEDTVPIRLYVVRMVAERVEYYDEVLLVSAAWLNELDLLKETLQSTEGIPGTRENLLRYAVSAAAYKGHNEAVRLLLDAIVHPKIKSQVVMRIVQSASKGNQLSTLEMGLKLDYKYDYRRLEWALQNTTSLPIFERLYPLAREVGAAKARINILGLPTGVLPDHFKELASLGAVPVLDHLLHHMDDLRLVTWSRPSCEYGNVRYNPLYRAARSGRAEAVAYLLQDRKKRFPLSPEVLHVAVQHGNLDVVRLLLEHPATADYPLATALLEATRRENEKVATMLLSMGSARLDGYDILAALDARKHPGVGVLGGVHG